MDPGFDLLALHRLATRTDEALTPDELIAGLAGKDVLVSAITDDQGEYIGAMATWEVITDRLEAERLVAQAVADERLEPS